MRRWSSSGPDLTEDNLKELYSPGIGTIALKIRQNSDLAIDYTSKGDTVYVMSDGGAVLGFGKTDPLVALPVMESKCLLHRKIGGLNGIPLCFNNPEELYNTVLALRHQIGVLHLQDLNLEEALKLKEKLKPLELLSVNDDLQLTPIAIVAALFNGLKEPLDLNMKITILGAGPGGFGVYMLLKEFGHTNLRLVDTQGRLHKNMIRKSYLKPFLDDKTDSDITFEECIADSKVLIACARPRTILPCHIASMASDPIVFALSNPEPQIEPSEAYAAGAKLVVAGNSSYKDYVNNVVVFPHFFRAAVNTNLKCFNLNLAKQLTLVLASLAPDHQLLPSPFDPNIRFKFEQCITRNKFNLY